MDINANPKFSFLKGRVSDLVKKFEASNVSDIKPPNDSKQKVGPSSFYEAQEAGCLEDFRQDLIAMMDQNDWELNLYDLIESEDSESEACSQPKKPMPPTGYHDYENLYEIENDSEEDLIVYEHYRNILEDEDKTSSEEEEKKESNNGEEEEEEEEEDDDEEEEQELYESISKGARSEPPALSIDLSPNLFRCIDHLKTTEKRHLQTLEEIVPIYTYVLKHHSSPTIQENQELIIQNVVKQLLDIQRGFQVDLSGALSFETVLSVFLDYEKMFEAYKKFFMTQGRGLIITIQNEQISLGSILNHRLIHYKMFLEEIREELRGHQVFLQGILSPLHTVCDVLDVCNKKLLLDDILNNPLHEKENSPIDLNTYGNYLLKGKFKVKRPHSMNLTAFLFDNIILLTKEVEGVYYYQGSIKTHDINLLPQRNKSSRQLKIHDFVKSKHFGKDIVYRLKAVDYGVHQLWRKKIEELLWQQKLLFREQRGSHNLY